VEKKTNRINRKRNGERRKEEGPPEVEFPAGGGGLQKLDQAKRELGREKFNEEWKKRRGMTRGKGGGKGQRKKKPSGVEWGRKKNRRGRRLEHANWKDEAGKTWCRRRTKGRIRLKHKGETNLLKKKETNYDKRTSGKREGAGCEKGGNRSTRLGAQGRKKETGWEGGGGEQEGKKKGG